jgi:hypothetical protein
VDVRNVLAVVAMVAVAAFAGGVVVGWQTDPSGGVSALEPTVTEQVTVPATPEPRQQKSRAERLLAAYGCWTGDAEGRPAPTHAVVTLPGERAELVDADTGYAIWLDGAPGELHGFCP